MGTTTARVGLICVAIAMLLGAFPDKAGACTPQGLLPALRQHEDLGVQFQWKMLTGYIRPQRTGETTFSAKRYDILRDGYQAAVGAVQGHLKTLDAGGRAAALIYEPRDNGCVWLVPASGAVEVEQTAVAVGTATAARDRLGVTLRAETRMPRKRNAPAQAKALTPPQKAGHDDLVSLRDAVIPPRLFQRIAKDVSTLLVLPAGEVSALPFAAFPLQDAGSSMLSAASVIFLPGLDGLFFWVKAPSTYTRALVVGDPDLAQDTEWVWEALPGARREAEAVARKLSARALVGKDATLAKVKQELGTRPSLVYFATHGMSDAINPMDQSFLALKDAHLRASEIRDLSYTQNHPLVVMSACQTGLGKRFSGGIFGLARAWVHAGAAQVVASQWDVSDVATAFLMERFMDQLVKGAGAQEALRLATIDASKSFDDPADWASFSLFGYAQPK